MRHLVARVQDFPPGDRRIVRVEGREIGVFRVGDAFYAVRNRCPHQGGPLCGGRVVPRIVSAIPGDARVEDGSPRLACPWHGWQYDLATGQSYAPHEPDARAYDVWVEQGAALAEQMEAAAVGRKGLYVAETFPVYVDDDYVVLDSARRGEEQ
jgi:nitrite reductase/ring-hydroxylating ferredoxin subunit